MSFALYKALKSGIAQYQKEKNLDPKPLAGIWLKMHWCKSGC